MHREIIINAFEKAKKEEIRETGGEASVLRCAERISAYIANVGAFSYGERSLRNFYRDATGHKDNIVMINKPEVVQILCQYVGYDSYVDFVTQNTSQEDQTEIKEEVIKEKPKSIVSIVPKERSRGALIALFFIGIISIPVIRYFENRQRWMIWDVDHYIEVSFDANKLQAGDLKIYKEERIEAFKKIAVSCDTTFFDANGAPSIFYGKNKNKELEYFTDLGKHPETGKALSPITKYMINKYVCNLIR